MDLRLDAEVLNDGRKRSGSLLLIDGLVLATKGDISEPGYEIDALDSAVLTQKLVLNLLGAALPGGPESIRGIRRVLHSDAKVGIQFATASAQGYISPPWRVTGTVTRHNPARVEYVLSLTSGTKSNAGGQSNYFAASFSGTLARKANVALDDSMDLGAWNILGLGMVEKKVGDSTIIDYSATSEPNAYRTVSDIRKKIAADRDPGAHDPTRDFTGFWKAKCEDSFGLSIEHFGIDGLYSIVFCGPGGCGAVEDGRKTYITGDKHFEVISDDELVEVGRNGSRDRSLRCTKNPHPVL
jgi:hypothetical protein